MPGVCSHFKAKTSTVLCYNFTLSQSKGLAEHISFQLYNKKKSWTEATQICKEIGGHLPYFTSKQHLDKLLAFIKLAHQPPAITAIFLGLKYSSEEVSPCTYLELKYALR